ncbi:MAG: hypothetical protein IKS32_13360, partial [Solobacterium sp.]|nr:hypothetical protein [Solobacterium sp.]
MNKKLLRTVFAAFLSVFMFGTSINPAVFADGEDETVENNEGNEDAQEKGTDVRKTITAFVLGELIPDEAESTEDVALPASLPAKLEGDAEEAEPVAAGVQWTENENAFNVSLNAESNEAYVLSENAQNQLNSISVAKSEVAEEDTAEAEIQAVTDDGSAQDQQAVTEEADSEQEALLGESAVVPWDGTTVSWDPYPGASGYKCYVVLEQTE